MPLLCFFLVTQRNTALLVCHKSIELYPAASRVGQD